MKLEFQGPVKNKGVLTTGFNHSSLACSQGLARPPKGLQFTCPLASSSTKELLSRFIPCVLGAFRFMGFETPFLHFSSTLTWTITCFFVNNVEKGMGRPRVL